MEPDRDAILKALEQVIDPELRRPVTELDMVRDVASADGVVSLTIVLTVAGCPLRHSFEEQIDRALAGVPGVTGVQLSFAVMTPEERQKLTTKLRGGAPADAVLKLGPETRVIAIASGKGGVGKSSLSANLAVALSQLGRKIGILDADIYGHSIPHILGIHQKPVAVDEMIVPPVKDDLKLMSIGFFLDGNEPVMWRGPMLHRALEQFLTDVHWGDLDVLIVDMPPGTGDVSISLGQLLPRAEVVVVTTPQKLAQDVASRAASMALKTNMRLLGVVENMSGEVFGSGGGDAARRGARRADARPRPARPAAARAGRPRRADRRRAPRGGERAGRSWRSPRRSTACGRAAAPSSSRCRSSADPMQSKNLDAVREVYDLARRANHRELRTRLNDDVTWDPAREGAWKPCVNADEVVRTLLWRAEANRMRPGEMIDLGDRVFVQLRGKRLERLGAKGFVPRLFQIVVLRDGKVVSIRDYARREDALAAAGLKA